MLVDGTILGTAASLHAAGSSYPATIGTAAGAAVLVIGGPLVNRYLGRLMLSQARPQMQRRAEGRSHSMSTARFDELIHAPTRLAIVSLLAAAQWADFKYIRDELGLSDSALSKQLSTLESAGYVEIRKGFVGKRPRTSASLSSSRPPGLRAARGGPSANPGQVTAGCWRPAGH